MGSLVLKWIALIKAHSIGGSLVFLALYCMSNPTISWGGILVEERMTGFSGLGLIQGIRGIGYSDWRLTGKASEESSQTVKVLSAEELKKGTVYQYADEAFRLRKFGKGLIGGILSDLVGSADTYIPPISQQVGSTSTPGFSGYGFGGPMQQAAGIVPFITLSERYDSNVFLAPKNIAGLQREDYVTIITPGIQIFDIGRYVTTRLSAAAVNQLFARNTGLNNIGFNGQARFDLSGLVQTISPNLYLQIYDTASYSPTPPGFLGGDNINSPTNTIDPNLPVNPGDAYIRGIQASRVDTLTNTSGIGGAYMLTPATSLQASYAYSFTEFGKNYVPAANASFFSSRTHLVSIGPRTQINPIDSLYLNYNYTRSEYNLGASTFETHGGTAGWTRILSQEFRSNVYAGAGLLQQHSQNSSGAAPQSNLVTYLGGANVAWRRGFTTATLSYTAGVIPSYYGDSGPLLNQSVSLTGSNRVYENVIVRGSMSYARNEAVNPASSQLGQSVFFETVGAGTGIAYLIAPSWAASLDYTFQYFKGSYGGTQQSEFTRSAATISLSKFWQ